MTPYKQALGCSRKGKLPFHRKKAPAEPDSGRDGHLQDQLGDGVGEYVVGQSDILYYNVSIWFWMRTLGLCFFHFSLHIPHYCFILSSCFLFWIWIWTLCNSKFRTTFPLGPSLVAQQPNVNFTTVWIAVFWHCVNKIELNWNNPAIFRNPVF